MRLFFACCLLFTFLLMGCNDPARSDQPNAYYDVAGYVKAQIADLSARKPLVTKAVSINHQQNQHTTQDVNWGHELDLFMQSDINKPALRSSYQITRPDSLTYRYTLKKSEERLTVRSLLVQLDPATHQPRRIEAVLQTRNPLYSSERHLLLESRPDGSRGERVAHYRLSGYQQLSYFDKNEFLVDGRVQ